jgi:hypothetical protein
VLNAIDTVVRIGNCHGSEADKLDRFGLTALRESRSITPYLTLKLLKYPTQHISNPPNPLGSPHAREVTPRNHHPTDLA